MTIWRGKITPGIVHLGLGAFHRAHQALITSEYMEQSGDHRWGIIGANIRSGRTLVEALQAHDNLCTVVETPADGEPVSKVVSAIIETIYAGADCASGQKHLLEQMAHPSTRIVTLTITEKGYRQNTSQSAMGFIVAALHLRKNRGLKPFTVLSCDNIADNGQQTRTAVLQLAGQTDKDLAQWLGKHGCFPSTVVDRIVPAGEKYSHDPCEVVCESFRQWIIEDNFVDGRDGRPDWNRIDGVHFVDNVKAWEDIKLRMLNGAHSFLAYTGYLGGYTTIREAVADPAYARVTHSLMLDVAAPTLSAPNGYDLPAYANTVLQRFQNPALAHTTTQIAMDGSQKIPQRWLNTARWHCERGNSCDPLALGLATWIQYISGVDEQGQAIDVIDPLSEKLKSICDMHKGDTGNRARAILSDKTIFDSGFPEYGRFTDSVASMAERLCEKGIRAMIRELSEATSRAQSAV